MKPNSGLSGLQIFVGFCRTKLDKISFSTDAVDFATLTPLLHSYTSRLLDEGLVRVGV